MTMNTNNTPINELNATEWQYSNDGSWDYSSESFAMKVENVFNTSIDKDKLQATINGRKLDDSTLYSVFDTNQDGKLTLSELSTVTKSMPSTKKMSGIAEMPTTLGMFTIAEMPTTLGMFTIAEMPTPLGVSRIAEMPTPLGVSRIAEMPTPLGVSRIAEMPTPITTFY